MRLLALIGAAAVAAGLAWPSAALAVADESGAVLWRVDVAEGTSVVLRYTNSIFVAPVWERFEVRDARLHLLEVASTSEAVLEYNRHEPPYRRDGTRLIASVRGMALDVLPLRVGERGRPTLEVGGVVIPLHEAGAGTGLRISIQNRPRLIAWTTGRRR